ncbi:MAG: UDP-N-acetylmuramoyl-L-alanyl-D-glutamate--2,6-diaminopimelate ligase, partial [Candidatus Omnitrophica bacterium]|nr:UDP-N-acetylmuramoyl-L-alanyl-D-glutamate--2,6-diaminopimelate ligase [Candidatus Omnitrophota bacterium]
DHLDYHKSLEDYFQAKAKLFHSLKDGAVSVINSDDAYGKRLVSMCRQPVITYGLDSSADVFASDIIMDTDSTSFILNSGGVRTNIRSRLIGKHNVYNVLAAGAWALNKRIEPAVFAGAVEEFTPVPGRLERIDAQGDVRVFVDYAHTQDALFNVISTLRQITRNKIIVVFGCGGDRDKLKRPAMGKVTTELADFAVITSDNPRSEDPQAIIEDITGGIKKENYSVVPDRKAAIRTALSKAGAGDIVLIAGKGHETYQIIKDKVLHFDDREAVLECLRSRN